MIELLKEQDLEHHKDGPTSPARPDDAGRPSRYTKGLCTMARER